MSLKLFATSFKSIIKFFFVYEICALSVSASAQNTSQLYSNLIQLIAGIEREGDHKTYEGLSTILIRLESARKRLLDQKTYLEKEIAILKQQKPQKIIPCDQGSQCMVADAIKQSQKNIKAISEALLAADSSERRLKTELASKKPESLDSSEFILAPTERKPND